MKLIDLERKISIINKKYNNINYGGCGIFAYYLYKVLKNKYGLDVSIVYYHSNTPPGKKPDYDICFNHILVEIDNLYHIDNNGFYNIDNTLPKLSIDKLEEMINIPLLWNDVFDHKNVKYLIADIESI